jgi:hypothetical protein
VRLPRPTACTSSKVCGCSHIAQKMCMHHDVPETLAVNEEFAHALNTQNNHVTLAVSEAERARNAHPRAERASKHVTACEGPSPS